MSDSDAVVVGGLILLAMATVRRESTGIAWGDGWHWPVPDLIHPDARYPATVSQEFKSTHRGVDIMYRRRSLVDRPEYPAGGPRPRNGSTLHFAPPGTPVLAARDARVWSVARLATGLAVVLDHGAPWATFYAHLESTTLPPHANGTLLDGSPPHTVRAGEVIGRMGWNPNTNPGAGAVDGAQLRHLHFEAWYKGGAGSGQDPSPVMSTWGRSSWRP